MIKRLIGIGTVMAVALSAGGASAEREQATGAQGPPQVRAQRVLPPAAQGQGQIGPGQPGPQPGGPGQMGPGRMGPGQLGPGQMGRGRMGGGRGRGGDLQRGAAGRPGAGRGIGPGARLDLTADQQAAIETLQRAGRDQSAGLRDELEFTRKTLRRETFADKRDAAKLTALAAKVTSLEKQLAEIHLKTQTAVADVLTPGQRETMRLMGDGRGVR